MAQMTGLQDAVKQALKAQTVEDEYMRSRPSRATKAPTQGAAVVLGADGSAKIVNLADQEPLPGVDSDGYAVGVALGADRYVQWTRFTEGGLELVEVMVPPGDAEVDLAIRERGFAPHPDSALAAMNILVSRNAVAEADDDSVVGLLVELLQLLGGTDESVLTVYP